MTISFTLGIPDGPNNPSQDQPKMKINNDNLALFLSIDHIPFDSSTSPSGYHNIIHMPSNATPIAIGGIGQLFCQTVSGDVQLFYLTALGGLAQLTGHSASTNGWAFIAGIIIQWGVTPVSSGNGVVNLTNPPNIKFPHNIFSVVASPQRPTATPGLTFNGFWVANDTISVNGFTIINQTTHSYGFYWMAIGN